MNLADPYRSVTDVPCDVQQKGRLFGSNAMESVGNREGFFEL